MAKDQDLSLNTAKLSGVCGRLMCCLAYEQQQYIDFKAKCPEIGSTVSTPNGKGNLISIDCIKEIGNVEFSENNSKAFPLSQKKKLHDREKDKDNKENDKTKNHDKNKSHDKK